MKILEEKLHVQDAGYFILYMERCFSSSDNIDRGVIQSIIGEKAERLVYLFCILGRETNRQTEIAQISDKQTRKELTLIDYANGESKTPEKR